MRLLFWLVWLVMITSPILGQSNDRRRFKSDVYNKGQLVKVQAKQALWRFGSFNITPIVGLRQLGYDSNVFSAEQNEVKDFSISPEVGLSTWWRLTPTLHWMNKATYNYVYYQDLSNLRGSEYGFESRIHGIFKKSYFDTGANYRHDRQRISSEIDDRVYSDRLTLDMTLLLQPTTRGHLKIRPKLYDLVFDDNAADLTSFKNLERKETTIEVSYLHKIKPQFWPFVEASLQSFDFKNKIVSAGDPGASTINKRDESEMSRFSVGFRNEYDRRLHYNVTVGMGSLTFDLAPEIDDDIVIIQAFANRKVTRQWDVEGDLKQEPIFSISSDYGFFVSRRIALGFGYRFRNKTRIGPEVVFGENEYTKRFNEANILIPLRTDDFKEFNINTSIPIGNSLEWQAVVGYSKRDVNLPGQSDEGLRLSMDVVYKLK